MNTQLKPNEALIVRLGVGLVFGLGIAWLIKTFDNASLDNAPAWVQILTSVLMLGAFILWAGAGAMKRVSLGVWGAVALGLIALIAWNRVTHSLTPRFNPVFFDLSFLIYPFLFISHELVSSADQAGKPIAPYSLYFDEAWKRGVQLALSVIFTALFWGILWLGAILLGFIGFDWFKDLLTNAWFAWPVSGMAIAASVNLGDVQTKLMHNFRALVLGVLSWLLPVITVIGLLFAVSLCFSGLEPLWKTKAATASLLAGCVALVLLINAAYQQGNEERPVHLILRGSARIACGLLLVFAGLAAYSLWLRIAQYGLTPERVMALVGVVIAVLYALGYTVAAVLPGRWLSRLEPVNIALAFIMALICLCVLTPIADPYRLSAQSQGQRVAGGKVTAETFDWRVLRFETGTYGLDELKRLNKTGKTDIIRTASANALQIKESDRWTVTPDIPIKKIKPTPSQIHMVKGSVPSAFYTYEYDPDYLPNCLQTGAPCEGAMIDLNNDHWDELLLLDGSQLYVINIGSQNVEWGRLKHVVELREDQIAAFKAGEIGKQESHWDDLTLGHTSVPVN